jgi:preprotein translocase SecE subunit
MARDRQRAKQRRKRQGGSAPRSGDRARTAREMGLDDSTVEDSGLGDGTPAPDPLKHSSAEVDQAKLAEAGAQPRDPETDELPEGVYEDELEDDDFERAPDEAEDDLVPAGPGTEHDEAVRERAERKPRGRVLTFLRHCADELRRVQWPNRRQVGQATAVVLGFVVIAGGYLGLLDALWRPLVDAIL